MYKLNSKTKIVSGILRCSGHVERMKDECMAKQLLEYYVDGKDAFIIYLLFIHLFIIKVKFGIKKIIAMHVRNVAWM